MYRMTLMITPTTSTVSILTMVHFMNGCVASNKDGCRLSLFTTPVLFHFNVALIDLSRHNQKYRLNHYLSFPPGIHIQNQTSP
mmetsp:Transcript_662/g.1602  ORF Transcript_662/g.1602 Transcript_662/m.1602 type:complete len:83 (-) Transcript_662:7165-7413(-)